MGTICWSTAPVKRLPRIYQQRDMKYLVVAVVIVFAASVFAKPAAQAPASGCRYWSQTPDGRYYCSDQGTTVKPTPEEHPGRCPPLLDRGGYSSRGPQLIPCKADPDCARVDKCCWDNGVSRHVCKTADQ